MKKRKKQGQIPSGMVPVVNEAKAKWGELPEEDRETWLKKARTGRVRQGPKLVNRAFSMFLGEYVLFREKADYRNGAEGFFRWVEEKVKFKVSSVENGEAVDKWVYAADLPDVRDEYGRSYRTLWENAKKEIRTMLEMRNGIYVRKLIVMCWPRGEGKSFISSLFALHRIDTFQFSRVYITGSSKAQSGNSLLDQIKTIIINSPKLMESIGEKGIQADRIVMRGSLNFIKQMSTQSGVMSNATMIIHTEAFEMENETFFENWYSSLRNTDNAMGIIDSTVSRHGHWLHRLYDGWRKKPDGLAWFSYRYSKDANPGDYWHPKNSEEQLQSYRNTMSRAGFAKKFLNLWDTDELSIFLPNAIVGTGYVGKAGTVFTDPENGFRDIVSTLNKETEFDERVNKRRIFIPQRSSNPEQSPVSDLMPVDELYSFGNHTVPKSNILTGSRWMDMGDIKRLTAEFETHWSLLLGIDMADALVPDEKFTARTALAAVLKGLPGSMNMSKTDKGKTGIKYVYFVAGIFLAKDNQPWTCSDAARQIKNRLGRIDMLCGEKYAITPVIALCNNLQIPWMVVNPNLKTQSIAMNEVITAVNTGRFKSPTVPIYGSKNSDILREEMGALDVVDERKGQQKIESREKMDPNGIRDDVWDAVSWSVYGGLGLTVHDFRERDVVGNTPVFGMFEGLPLLQDHFGRQFGLEEIGRTIH